ncbi:FAD-dependent oxidoreductase [Nocardia sp. NPDC127526]|uniref:FAD-dependent oxidoreductase n=1 Tax=Nocardia sp. NPDC127526 TaxID=3345393 RepID=UPI003627E320
MVAVIGAGIAGCALAGGLARRGEAVQLYEQQRSGSAGGGAFLFMDDRGHRALTELGVSESAVEAGSYPVTGGLDYTTSTGRFSAVTGRGHRFWMRRNLIGILADFVADSGAEIHYGTPITDVTLTESGCILHHNGSSTTVDDDLIVAADGIDSVVRARLEPDRPAEYAGDVVLYGMTTEPVTLPTPPATLHFFAEMTATGAPGSTLGHIWRPGDPAALWFLRVPRPPLPGTSNDIGLRPVAEWTETITAATPSNEALLKTLLAATESVHVSNARDVPLTNAATPTTPVLLIGDADHAITPAAGVGARDALEDAHAVYQARLTSASPATAMADRRTRIVADREQALRGRRQAR